MDPLPSTCGDMVSHMCKNIAMSIGNVLEEVPQGTKRVPISSQNVSKKVLRGIDGWQNALRELQELQILKKTQDFLKSFQAIVFYRIM